MGKTDSTALSDSNRAALINPDPSKITVWSDIGCPWAALALHTLREAAKRRDVELGIDHRAFPLELFNQSPTPKELVDAEVTVIAGRVPELGWQLWHGATHAYPSAVLPALEAVQAAKNPAVGGLRASNELDAALRDAFYIDSRCISIMPVILDIAEQCSSVDHHELERLLARGEGRSAVYGQWRIAQGSYVQGSPHLFSASGLAIHNPGVTYHWTGRPPLGFPLAPHGLPVFEHYDPTWTEAVLDAVSQPKGSK